MSDPHRIRVIVTADDYGLSPGVSDGIRALLDRGRLSATSCMTASHYWRDHAARLDPSGQYDLGLHLTLSDQKPLTSMPCLALSGHLPSPGRLLWLCATGRLPKDEVQAEIAAQLDAFEDALGRPPDHVDGHQHTHQFPVIRDLLVETLATRYDAAARKPYLRVCAPLKMRLRHPALALQAFGIGWFAPPLRRLAEKAGIPVNNGFTGVYDLSARLSYESLFAAFLQGARDNTIVMCHPGHPDEALRNLDTLTDRREDEFRFFAGDRYPDLMARANATPSRFAETRNRME